MLYPINRDTCKQTNRIISVAEFSPFIIMLDMPDNLC